MLLSFLLLLLLPFDPQQELALRKAEVTGMQRFKDFTQLKIASGKM